VIQSAPLRRADWKLQRAIYAIENLRHAMFD
jgi:hypothetical protein